MEKKANYSDQLHDQDEAIVSKKLERRTFLRFAGATTAAAVMVSAGCQKLDYLGDVLVPKNPSASISLGSGDVGILNYAFVLEQLEAAFYTLVISDPYNGITGYERQLITDVRDHEIAHREFYRKALGSKAVGDIVVNLSMIDFTSRKSVLTIAKAFEDLGVSAYNGAGQLLTTPDYLVLAGKIVSVEARHAAFFRDLLEDDSFADSSVVNGMGLDTSRMPSEVLPLVQPYVKTKIDGSQLPTS